MAIPKVCGIETEYGVIMKAGEDYSPILASSLLVNSYAHPGLRRIRWDYDEESPLRDARGFERPVSERAPDEEAGLVSVILENGARYYVDHAHPEYSTPECSNALDLVAHDKAGERILEASLEGTRAVLDPSQRIMVYKNNSDFKGNSYGCHENYLVDRSIAFPQIVAKLIPFLVTRQIYTGAGKVGSENGTEPCDFQISQRADFFEVEVGLETTFKRPLVNTRDEPHADPDKYRRLHVILGDANMCETATFLKIGVTSIILKMIEDRAIGKDLWVQDPVRALRTVSHDPNCKATLAMNDESTASAVEIQWEYLELARKYLAQQDTDPITDQVMQTWDIVLAGLETDPRSLDRRLDWAAKLNLLEAYRDRHGLDWDSAKLKMLDLQYHDVRQDKGLYYKLAQGGHVDLLVSEEDVRRATVEAPHDTRAWFRGEVVRRFS